MPSIPEKMLCAVYYSNTDVRLEERPVPKIGYGEILVKTEACGLCGGETMEWYLAPRAPWVLGHEPSGVVAQVGEGVKKFKVGDRVFVHHHVSCMSCHFCNRGYYSMCEQYSKTKLDPGGFAEYFRVPAQNVQFDTQILPDNVTFEQGTLLEPMGCTLSGLKACNIRYGDTVAIVGLGFMGMSYLEQAVISPAAKIVGLDFSDWRLDKARELGATHTINPKKEDSIARLKEMNEGRLADVVIVTAPFVSAWDSGLKLCEKAATLHLGAPVDPNATWTIQANPHFRETKIVSTYSSSQVESTEVLDLIAAGRLNVNPLITHRFGLDGVKEAIQLMLKANDSLKPMIIPSMTKVK
ncbi:MAG: alcohol dehydrogenase catalytic domain-containing protein [Anaerolineae bacterium]|nr:alcohol dehydrogenase catalytic domain-containing protein [Anaerolineae bacterium]